MIRFIILFLSGLFVSSALLAQVTGISGPIQVDGGATDTYTVVGSVPGGVTVQWVVPTGGTITSSNNSSCTVQWVSQNGVTGVLLCTGGGGAVSLTVQIGDLYVRPASQIIQYGSVPSTLTMVYNEATPATTYQWQISTDGSTWTPDAAGSGNALSFSTGATTSYYYRCIATTNGTQVTSSAATITVPGLSPGSIGLSTSVVPTYNAAAPVFSDLLASGGTCAQSQYTYTWWQSVENGPWTSIGSGASFPSGAPALIGNTSYMRSVTCGIQTLYTNVVSATPSYTGVNSENYNYVRVDDIQIPGIQSWYQADQLATGSKFQTTNYLDGLGRVNQKVVKQVSQSGGVTADIVTPHAYDNFGRPALGYNTYADQNSIGLYKTSAISDQSSYLNGFFSTPTLTPLTYNQKAFESSPLNRILSYTSEGKGQISTFQADFNQGSEMVHIWTISYTPGSIPATTSSSVYGTGALIKRIMTDQAGQQTILYYDLTGNLILKKVENAANGGTVGTQHAGWLCTYYVYDDFNHLRFSISPRAVAWLDANSWALNSTIASALCSRYEYDARGRLIVSNEPGQGEVDMVYDDRDRLVFLQDGNNRTKNQWIANLYDNFDRQTILGFLNNVSYTAATLQGSLNGMVIGGSPIPVIINTNSISIPVNLQVPYRNTSVSSYTATNSINFESGFTTASGDAFTASINTTGNTTTPQTMTVSSNPLPSGATLLPLIINYYDNYNFSGVKSFSTDYTFPSTTSTTADPIQHSIRVTNMVTGQSVRVINDENYGDDIFLNTTTYYDEKARTVQSLSDNASAGTDVFTEQHDFSGKPLSLCEKHTIPGTAYNDFPILTQYNYDAIGRLVSIGKSYNNAPVKLIDQLQYDGLGQLSNKALSPNFQSSTPLETQAFTYNIQGWLTGINKNYATSASNTNQWTNYFGVTIGYDDNMGIFNSTMGNGNVAGISWKSQGDNMMRKYDYTFDYAYRFAGAAFGQRNTTAQGWSNTQADFSAKNISYDENGNIQALTHMGMAPGNSTPLIVDGLQYAYLNGGYSNQVASVTDAGTQLGTSNGNLGDFKDGSNGSANDYQYDNNGNLNVDNNKGIGATGTPGIVFSILDRPYSLTITGQKQIAYTYLADGTKLNEQVTNLTNNQITNTSYDGDLVFSNGSLQYILNEEGQVSISQPLSQPRITIGGYQQFPGTDLGTFEYFIRDHQDNIRQVLTEQSYTETNNCTMELTPSSTETYEESMFGQVDANGNPTAQNEVITTRVPTAGTPWTSNTSAEVSQLQATGTSPQIGPNVLMKVMAGDQINGAVNYFFQTPTTQPVNDNLVGAVAQALVGAFTGGAVSAASEGAIAPIQSNLGAVGGALDQMLDPIQGGNPTNLPKASLTYLFFDNNFNFIAYNNASGLGSNAVPVTTPGNNAPALTFSVKAPQNGYVYVYISNATQTQPVYFDNLTVVHQRGQLQQEDHYYPYGLKIEALHSDAYSKLENRYGLMGSEFSKETGYNEFFLRNYDPQIGRWTSQDPYNEFESPYVGFGGNPVSVTDPSGGDVLDMAVALGLSAVAGVTSYFIAKNNGANGFWSAMAAAGGAFAGAGLGYGTGAFLEGNSFTGGIEAFYKGFLGQEGVVEPRGNFTMCPTTAQAIEIPNIWGWVPSLPSKPAPGWPVLYIQFPDPLKFEDGIEAMVPPILHLNITTGRTQTGYPQPTKHIPPSTPRPPKRVTTNFGLPISAAPSDWNGDLDDDEVKFVNSAINRLKTANSPEGFVLTMQTGESMENLNTIVQTDAYEVYDPKTGLRAGENADPYNTRPYKASGKTDGANLKMQAEKMARKIEKALGLKKGAVRTQISNHLTTIVPGDPKRNHSDGYNLKYTELKF